jgi:hypothetical protein
MPVKSLLKIKHLREESASRHLAKTKQELTEKESALKTKEKELADFIVFKKQEKIRLFEELKAKKDVVMKEVNISHHYVSNLNLKEAEKNQLVNEAKKALENATQAYEDAKADYFKKYKDKRKIEEIYQEITQIEEAIVLYKEEMEQEDIASRAKIQ